MAIDRFNPDGLYKPGHSEDNRKYSQVVVSDPGQIVHVAGTIPLDEDGNLVGRDDIKQQSKQVLRNIEASLAGAGCDQSNLVDVQHFTTRKLEFQAYGLPHFIQWYGDHKPASTAIGVAELAPGVLLETNATAIKYD